MLLSCGRTSEKFEEYIAPATISPLGSSTSVIESINSISSGYRVNKAQVRLVEGSSNNTVELQTLSDDNSVGSYYGNGTGNLAIFGVHGFDGVEVLELSSLNVMLSTADLNDVNLTLHVDLTCSGDASDFAELNVDLTQYSLDSTLKLVSINSDDIVFSLNGDSYSLDDFVVDYSSACLRDMDPLTDGTPKNTVLPAIIIKLGNSNSSQSSKLIIDDFEINTASTLTLDFEGGQND